jgi:uncharacterized DUF497 family protein
MRVCFEKIYPSAVSEGCPGARGQSITPRWRDGAAARASQRGETFELSSPWREGPLRDKLSQVVYWQHFEASEWHIEYDAGKLASHGISEWEAEEVIWGGFVARPNKKEHGPNRYQLAGRTDGGRPLLLIVHIIGDRQMRVLNGWPL